MAQADSEPTTWLNALSGVDPHAIRSRLEVIAEALEIPRSEIARALQDEEALIDFALSYQQSLDWIIEGDVRGMLRARWDGYLRPRVPRRPALRLVHSKPTYNVAG